MDGERDDVVRRMGCEAVDGEVHQLVRGSGWRCTSRMPTELPLDALEMVLWTRGSEAVPVVGDWTG